MGNWEEIRPPPNLGFSKLGLRQNTCLGLQWLFRIMRQPRNGINVYIA